jgi:hypothetical protein
VNEHITSADQQAILVYQQMACVDQRTENVHVHFFYADRPQINVV